MFIFCEQKISFCASFYCSCHYKISVIDLFLSIFLVLFFFPSLFSIEFYTKLNFICDNISIIIWYQAH